MNPLIGKRVTHNWAPSRSGRVVYISCSKGCFRFLVMTQEGGLQDEPASDYTVDFPDLKVNL